MRYGYGRVSAKDQSLARQLAALKAYAPDLDDDHIFTDKQSGKNFNRKQYIKLKSILLPGDEVLVEELDRLGRNKEEIKAELEWFKAHGVIVRVFDIPTTLIDFQGQDWVADMVNNILIEVLGAVAERLWSSGPGAGHGRVQRAFAETEGGSDYRQGRLPSARYQPPYMV